MTQDRIDRRQALAIAVTSVCASAMNGCKRHNATNTELKMPDAPISLSDLHQFDTDVRSRVELPQWADPGIGYLGLILDSKPDGHRYEWCTPTNCQTFAGTGGEGVHFSLMQIDGTITAQSPIVVTTPGGGDGRSWIVGSDMRDFLSLGYHRGYFALEQLSGDQELTLTVFTTKDWQPSESWHDSVGYTIGPHHQEILDLLIERFALRPWQDPQHFYDLQKRLAPLLELPAGLSS